MDISIIIVTYNSANVIADCLKSVPADVKTYIVDNASSDNTLDIANKTRPSATIIKNITNQGYGRANNIALEPINTKYALLLNPDARLNKNTLQQLYNVAENSDYAILSPTLVEEEHPISNTPPQLIECPEVIGACMFLRMVVFKQIGFFDANLFMYGEDNELCARTLHNDYKIAEVQNIYCQHIGNGSTPYSNVLQRTKLRMMAQSQLYIYQKYNGKFKMFLHALRKVKTHLFKAIIYLVTSKRNKRMRHYNKAIGMLQYCLRGKSVLFDNELSKTKAI